MAPTERSHDARTRMTRVGVTVAAFRARAWALARRPTTVVVANRVADRITRFGGSMTFVALHLVWFAVWIVVNLVARRPFDPFPFGLLTLIVSLEAIFLTAFVLLSENRQAAGSDARARQDFQTNVYAEVLVELIAQRVGVDLDEVESTYHGRMRAAGYRVSPFVGRVDDVHD